MANLEDLRKTKDQLDQTSPSFCLAKWKTATIHLFNGNTQSCHHVPSHAISDPNGGYGLHNTPQKIKQRQQMLSGQRPKGCEYCWKVERAGQFSDRVHKSQEDFAASSLPEVLKSKLGENIFPSYLELAFENACQFRCMYCSPTYSSRWQKEIDQYGPYPTLSSLFQTWQSRHKKPLPPAEQQKMIDAFWLWWPKLRQHLKVLRITGGEPFLSPHTFHLMEHLIREPQPHIDFGINTNMGFTPVKFEKFLSQIRDLQASVKKVSIFTSIDSVGKQAEYIRYGLNFSDFQKNIHKTLTMADGGFTLCFMVTVNALSLPGLKPLLQWIIELKKAYPQHQINVDLPYLRQPQYLSVQILSDDFKIWLIEAIDFMKAHIASLKNPGFTEAEVQKLQRILPFVAPSDLSKLKILLLRRDFTKMLTEYDRRKGCDFLSTFPEYRNFWQQSSVIKRPSF
ncbi:MAG: radical SAM protein [Bdellovibrionales bacterium]|nr:radical SAM protein [Bdellovibrionales bacterium]